MKGHSVLSMHAKCALAINSFEETHNGKQGTVDASFDARRQQLYDSNCKWLDTIIDCVLLCVQHMIAFWGHDDSNASLSARKGNSKTLLEYKAFGDELL